MKAILLVLVLAIGSLAVAGEAPTGPSKAPATTPRRLIQRCQPYVEKCPACTDCSRCRACSKEGNRCSVKRSQLGMRLYL